MVKKLDKANILKQKEILSKLIDINTEVISEYEAQNILMEAMIKLKEENNFDNFALVSFVKDDTLVKWKSNVNSESDYFVKVFYNEIKYAKDTYGLTNLEVSFLYEILEYLSWEENLLVDNEGLPLNQKRLCDITGMDRKKIYKCTKSLEEKKCMLRIFDGKDVYYLINPSLVFKGQKINKGIPKIFEMIGYIDCKHSKKI